jgi:hypothetical protein
MVFRDRKEKSFYTASYYTAPAAAAGNYTQGRGDLLAVPHPLDSFELTMGARVRSKRKNCRLKRRWGCKVENARKCQLLSDRVWIRQGLASATSSCPRTSNVPSEI